MNQYKMFFVQTPMPTSIMHQNFTEHEQYCMQNNQLLIKTPVEIEE